MCVSALVPRLRPVGASPIGIVIDSDDPRVYTGDSHTFQARTRDTTAPPILKRTSPPIKAKASETRVGTLHAKEKLR